MRDYDTTVIMDNRLKKNIESLYKYENGSCSIKFKDINDTFWFNDKEELQDFVNNQASERYYDKSLRKGYFDYVNEYNEKFRYQISNVCRGKLELQEEFVV